MIQRIRTLFSKPTPAPAQQAEANPYMPTPEREAGLRGEAFDAGYWAWKNRDGQGPVDVFPPSTIAALTRTPYEQAVVCQGYVDGLAAAIAQEKSKCH